VNVLTYQVAVTIGELMALAATAGVVGLFCGAILATAVRR
jgi:hypothetical protein